MSNHQNQDGSSGPHGQRRQSVPRVEISEPEIDIKELIGQNLKSSREAAELSQEAFAEMLGISRATLSGFENGHVAIDTAKLLTASRLLAKPVADFFRKGEPALTLLYRSAEDVQPNADIQAKFQRLCGAYRELEEIVGVADMMLTPPEYRHVPGFHPKPHHFAAQVAQSERERLGLGQMDPVENIFKLLDENGVRVFALDVDQDRVFGISAFSGRYGPCILVNKRNTRERNIFTAAHEYGHLVMHRDLYVNPTPAEQKDQGTEEAANTFAAHFLVPEAGLRALFQKNVGRKNVGVEDIVFLKLHFRVSAQMMLRRLRDSELIHPRDHDHQLELLRIAEPDKTKEVKPLSTDPITAWEPTCRFDHLKRKAALAEMISIGKLAELLGSNVTQVRSQVQSWRKEISFAHT